MMAITRLTGGTTPADGSDPRTFPAIWNPTADLIEDLAFGVEVAGSDSVNLDFADDDAFVSRMVGGTAVVVSGSGYALGRSKTLRLVGGSAIASVSVPAEWVFVGGAVGTALGTAVTAVLAATAFGTAASDVVAAWAES